MPAHLIALILVTLATPSFCQTSDTQRGFAMDAPQGWSRVTNDSAIRNVEEFVRFTAGELQRILATEQGTVNIVTYSKEPLDTDAVEQPVEGGAQTTGVVLIPKIAVYVTRNPTRTFTQFFAWASGGAENFTKAIPGFSHEPLREVEVDGRRSVVFHGTMDVPVKPNITMKARTRVYFVPVGGAAYQITFTDTPGDDCTGLFDRLVASVRFR